jgi:hypothetical protein
VKRQGKTYILSHNTSPALESCHCIRLITSAGDGYYFVPDTFFRSLGILKGSRVNFGTCWSGITGLGLDHTSILGRTIQEIAWHKASTVFIYFPSHTTVITKVPVFIDTKKFAKIHF